MTPSDVVPPHSADGWPIATCLHGIPTVGRDGVSLHDAEPEAWREVFREVADVGFDRIELADSHLRPADYDPGRRDELIKLAGEYGIAIPSLHVARRSVIMPGHEQANLDYAHRSIDAAAAWGMEVFSTGLHQPFSTAQQSALWFWTAPGPEDPDDPEVWTAAVSRLRELGRHAAEVGLRMSLELYEDTYLGTAAGAVRLIEEIGLDNVGLNPDVGNLIRLHRRVEDWRELYARTLPYANYWHLKNYHRDEAADGSWFSSAPATLETGLINYRQVIKDAVAAGYGGILLMEHYGGDSLGVCATNQGYLRGLLRQATKES